MTSIFVAKLDFNTTDEQLKGLFEEYGKVNRVTIAKDKETGKPRGFAFVEMFNEQEAEAAIEGLDNSSVNGRTIAVKKADDRSSGGGKPQGAPSGGFNKVNDRPRGEFKPRGDFKPREDNSGSSTNYKSDYKSNDEPKTTRPNFSPDDVIQPKQDRTKKDKDPKAGLNKDAPKKNKMEAYKKSGKDNQFLDDDDLLDDELDLFGRNSEEEDDDDYRKYLVNSDDDSDEYDEDDDWEDDEDYEDDED